MASLVTNYNSCSCIKRLLRTYENMGWRMSLKIHFSFCLQNLGAVSDEYGEKSHQLNEDGTNYRGK